MIKNQITVEVVQGFVKFFFFFECNAFSNLNVRSVGTYLDCSISDHLDLDVFLLNACDTIGGYTKDSGKCCYFQNFEFARDLFAAFCSVLIRMYLNYTVECFSDFLSRVSLSDEQKIIQKILKHAYIILCKFWDDTNYKFFYEFFDMFDKVNSSVYYQNVYTKPTFGPYDGPRCTFSVIYFEKCVV